MYAAKKGDLQLIHTILKHNPQINNKDSYNRNALFFSINPERGDNADIVLTLIKSNINVNDNEILYIQKGLEGHSPLTLAAKLNFKNTVKALLDNSANLDYQIPLNGNTALHYAILNSNIEVVKMLINNKANIDIKNKNNKNAIELSMENSNTEIYALLAQEINKLNEEKEKIVQDIVKTESENSLLYKEGNYKNFEIQKKSNKKNKNNHQLGQKDKESPNNSKNLKVEVKDNNETELNFDSNIKDNTGKYIEGNLKFS